MALIVVLIGAMYFVLTRGRRLKLAGVSGPIRVLESKSLGGRERLVIVEVEGKRLLLSSSEKGTNLLSELDRGRPAAEQLKAALAGKAVGAPPTASPGVAGSPPVSPVERPSYFKESPDKPAGKEDRFGGGKSGGEARSLRERLRSLRGRT